MTNREWMIALALGGLMAGSRVSVRVGEEWHTLAACTPDGTDPQSLYLRIGSVTSLVQAEEVKVHL